MPGDFAILSDDRGWPMAHEVLPDGRVAERACGSFIGPRPVTFAVTVNGIVIADATIEVDWFHVAPSVGEAGLWAGGWMIVSQSPALLSLNEADRAIRIELAGRPAIGTWNGVGRVRGTTPFPFTVAEWDAITGVPTPLNLPPSPPALPPKRSWWRG